MNFSCVLLRRLSFLPFLICAMLCKLSYGGIYAYVDGDGELIISDRREDARFKAFNPAKFIPFNKSYPATSPEVRAGIKNTSQQYASIINDIAQEVGVNADLIHAVIQVESAYNPNAISSRGAQGLMQLIPATAARFGIDQVHDPESNIRGGARYLKNLLGRFDNDLELTLAAYNSGEGTVQKYKNTIPPYPETQAYVIRVLDVFNERISRERNSS